jgi:nicotinate-nucleotide adenylyltransferase
VPFLPTARPPHKQRRELAPAWARYAMVELALLDDERLEVSPYELTLDRPAYTVETLEHFRDAMPGVELCLLLGEDSYRDLPQWVRAADIVRLARLIVLARPETGGRPELPVELAPPANRAPIWVEHPVDISSTAVREALRRGEEPPAGALDPRVVQYVRKYRLYR